MSDILDSIGNAAGKAFDFLTPTTDRRGAGFSFGDLVNTAGDIAKNSVLGGVDQLDEILTSDVGSSTKLFTAGLIAAGGVGAIGAHRWGATRKIERQMAPQPAVSRWSPAQGDIGLRPRYAPDSPEGAAVVRQHPGIRPRTADVLGSADEDELTRRLGHPILTADPVRRARSATSVRIYADSLQDLPPEGRFGAAQLDLAKLDTAFDGKIIKAGGPGNDEFRGLWERFRSGDLDPQSERGAKFVEYLARFGRATSDIVEPDMSFDMTARVTGIDFTPDNVVLKVKLSDADPEQALLDPQVRSARIKALNLRPLAPRGKEFMKRLYDLGVREQATPGVLPRPLTRGSGWYAQANQEIKTALDDMGDVPWVDRDVLTAAVSLTSEAQQWEGNIALAVSALRRSNDPAVLDPDFQDWLRDGTWTDGAAKTGRRTYVGARATQHQALFGALHTSAKRGNQLTEDTYKKVLRLASESPAAVLLSTSGRKQKNFHLNLKDPSDSGPITVDRHMHDVFLGLATSSDFKLLESFDLGDSNYDLIADTLRELADEVGVPPNEIQGVVWETWKTLKEAHKPGRAQVWTQADPFMLPEADGTPNRVFRALRGDLGTGVTEAMRAVPDRIMLVEGTEGRSLYTTPDSKLGVIGPNDSATEAQFRHLYPAVLRADGAAMYGAGRANKVDDVESLFGRLESSMSGHRVETWNSAAWPDGHPAMSPFDHVMIEVPDGPLPAGIAVLGSIQDPKQANVLRRGNRSAERLRARDLDPALFDDPDRSPLVTHDWASIEAAPRPDGTGGGSWKQLVAEFRATGYDPIVQEGAYEGVRNRSVLVFGITPAEALEVGKRYNQESIAAPGGLFYTDGTVVPADGVRFGVDLDTTPGSATTVRGREVTWTLTGLDFDSDRIPAERVLSRSNRRARTIAVRLKDPSQVAPTLDALREVPGATVTGVYSRGVVPAGYVRAREHVFTDGTNTMLVRTADPEFQSPNGFNVWVPRADADGLPKANPDGRKLRSRVETVARPDGSLLVGGSVHVRGPAGARLSADVTKSRLAGKGPDYVVFNLSGRLPEIVPTWSEIAPQGEIVATVRDGGLLLAADRTDLTGPAEVANVLGQLGIDPATLRTNVGTSAVRAEFVEPKLKRGFMTTVFGDQVPELRRSSSPLPDWRSKYGINFDPAWRAGNGKVMRIDPGFLDEFDAVTDRVMRDHEQLLTMAGLSSLGMATDLDPTWYAAYVHDPARGSQIQFSTRSFGSPEQVRTQRLHDIESNWMSPNLPPTAGAVLAHEYGHAIHAALKMSFWSLKDAAKHETDVLQKIKRSIGDVEAQTRKVSGYGARNVQEFVAESLAEAIFADTPRSVPLLVYRTVMDQFAENTKWRKTWSAQ